jgi:hypothetical protein
MPKVSHACKHESREGLSIDYETAPLCVVVGENTFVGNAPFGEGRKVKFQPSTRVATERWAIRYLEWVAGEGFKDGKSR